MLTIELPTPVCPEASHCVGVIFDDWLGVPHRLTQGESGVCRLRFTGCSETLVMPAAYRPTLGALPPSVWKQNDLPIASRSRAVLTANVLRRDVPILSWEIEFPSADRFGDEPGATYLPIDVIGAACFMLTRREELESPVRDAHDRFPAAASLACREGFLDQPIIDEYVEALWAVMKRIWPRLGRKPRGRTMRVTCDVDSPCVLDYRVRSLCKDVVKTCSPGHGRGAAASQLKAKWHARQGRCDKDPHYSSFDWMMDVNERAGNQMTFYFLAGGHDPRDGRYRLSDPAIRKLIARIHARGHEIGLHPSYQTFRDENATRREADELRKALAKAGVMSAALGSRQHYLRWDPHCTARHLEAAGVAYDSTLGYADRPGFRCGTSRDFRMYDVNAGRPMALVERPLVLMECSILGSHYMNMSYDDETLAYMQRFKDRSLAVGGQFTLLWHNSYFDHPHAKGFYETLVS